MSSSFQARHQKASIMESPPFTLPDHHDLPPNMLGFLEDHFSTHECLFEAHNLESELQLQVADSNTRIANLQRNLTKLVVKWISVSVTAQNDLQRLDRDLKNRIPCPSRYETCSLITGKVLREFAQLVKEVCRVDTVRTYAETALRLESLVGDLEDAVFCIMNQHSRTTFLAKLSMPPDFQAKQERSLQAVRSMSDIEEVLIYVKKMRPQWCHLIKSVDNRLDEILAVLRPQIFADYRSLFASIGWPPSLSTSKFECNKISDIPNPLGLMTQDKREKFSKSFLALSALQQLQNCREARQFNLLKQEEENSGIWGIDELVSAIAIQTEYHFTKWAIDQPELILALSFRITQDFVLGVDAVLQPLIDRARLLSYSAKGAWVFSMVQMLATFLEKRIFPVVAEKYSAKRTKTESTSSWLHLIDLITAFDKRMQTLVSSEPGSLEGFSRGLSALSVFCNRPDWLKIWAKIELKDAWKKLKSELKDEKAWLITEAFPDERSDQYLLFTTESLKYPLIAESVVKYAWFMIERCRDLPSVLVKSQFIRLTANRFFWYFFKVLLLRCKRPKSPCVRLDDDVLVRISGSINAVRYIESKLQEWSNDVNFLEMRIAEIKSCPNEPDRNKDNTCFFGDELESLSEFGTNWLMEIITNLILQFEILSREYFHKIEAVEQMNTISVPGNMDLALSYNLFEALDFLRSQLQVMKTLLNPIDFIDLWRSVADGIDHFIFRNILESNIQFSDEVANQFRTDMQAMFLVFQPFCARPEAFFPCLRDSLKLLKLNREEVSHLVSKLSKDNRTKNLSSCKISHLFSDQVRAILKMRKF